MALFDGFVSDMGHLVYFDKKRPSRAFSDAVRRFALGANLIDFIFYWVPVSKKNSKTPLAMDRHISYGRDVFSLGTPTMIG